ncbi:MAG: GNAT family N-acetyltransferase [Eubacterium sp.]
MVQRICTRYLSEIILPKIAENNQHVWHIFAIRTKNRDELQKYLDNKGIGTVIHYPTAIHLQEAYDDLKFKKDAPFMLEWMHDQSINCNFRFDASSQTLETAEIYIETANQDKKNKHFAVVDDKDDYQGTISLKEIDKENLKAEYAVCFRACAQGKGYASFATQQILKYGFDDLGLNRIYLNVLSENMRAISFYKKIGFIYEGQTMEDLIIKGKRQNLEWYRLLKKEYLKMNALK